MSNVSLDDLQAQIRQLEAQRAQLQAEMEKRREEEKAGVVQELIERIATYGITAKDLGLNASRAEKAGKAKPTRRTLGAKIAQSGKTYTGPNGQTWNEGTRGRKPAWLKEQLSSTPKSAE